MARWFVLLIFAFLASSCKQDAAGSWDPVEQFPNARTVHLIGLNDRLGSDAAMPFLGGNPTFHHESGTADFQEHGEINFFLFHPQAVKVNLEGRSNTTSQIEFLVNGHRLKKARVSAEWSRIELELPVTATLRGKNALEFRFPGTTTWRQVAFESPEPKAHLAEGPGPASLQLPFDAILDYPVSEDSLGTVTLEVEPWVEEGAPAIETWQLDLEFKNEKGERIASRMVRSEGDKSVQFPTLPPHSILTLRATAPNRLPGQSGLILKGKPPVLAPPAPTTAKNLPAPVKHPTVVLFVVDTLRADYLQPYGFPHPTSPRLQEFRKEAVLYQECLAPSPWTKPSMATLVTGLPPEEHGVLDFADRLSEDSTTVAEILSESGYQCRAWVNNGLLDKVFGYAQGYQTYSMVPAPTGGLKLVDDALKSLTLSDTAPSLLYFHLLDPHTPYLPSDKNRKKMLEDFGLSTNEGEWGSAGLEQKEVSRFIAQLAAGGEPQLVHRGEVVKALYGGCVADADEAFGVLTDWLKENDLYDNALIVVTSDHGEELMDHGSVGHLTTLYRELVRVPLLIKFPHGRRAGGTVE
ncbi:MAG: sulfatase, partial [Candidatus Eremiobacteraeota bacterium]|nr:sulfatase [Candidatus Eremiobacteraeota bacterium]